MRRGQGGGVSSMAGAGTAVTPAPARKNGGALRVLDLERLVRLAPSVRGERFVRSTAKLHLAVRGDVGAAHFELALQWYAGDMPMALRTDYPPRGLDLSLHSRAPRWGIAGQSGCIWLDGADCWSHRLGIDEAEELAQRALYLGDSVIWDRLEQLYREAFV